MGIFGKIGQAARYTQNMAEKAVEIGKIKVKILRKNEEIRREKIKIGEIIFEKHNSGEEIPPEVVEMCEKINDCSAEIEILSNVIGVIKAQDCDCCGCNTCPKCGASTDFCEHFCSNCGTNLDDDCGCGCCDDSCDESDDSCDCDSHCDCKE